jgi:outer membrane protein assembly factor BamB
MSERAKHPSARLAVALSLLIPSALAAQAPPDWPRFHGPNVDSRSTETGLLGQWPDGGPRLLWKLDGLGKGYSTVSIAGGRIFTMGDLARDGSESQYVMAYDLVTRRRLWETRIGPPHDDGPRCTPTVDGDLAYVIGASGDLTCVTASEGKAVWRKNFESDFGGKMMSVWRFSESPLVDGDKLVCTPGGDRATIVALDKRSGETIWRCGVPKFGERGRDGAGYASMVIADVGGIRQYVQMLGRGVVGVEADTGRFLWGYNRVANNVANVTSPVVRGSHVFVTTSYKTGCALLKLTRQGNDVKAQEVYFLGPDKFENHHGGVVLVGDHLYGGDGQNQGGPVCLELLTGKIAWKPKSPGRGSAAVLCADGNVIFRYDKGEVFLIEAVPEAFRIKGRFTPVLGEGPAWAHPVIHDGKLYLRHGDVLACYDLRSS